MQLFLAPASPWRFWHNLVPKEIQQTYIQYCDCAYQMVDELDLIDQPQICKHDWVMEWKLLLTHADTQNRLPMREIREGGSLLF